MEWDDNEDEWMSLTDYEYEISDTGINDNVTITVWHRNRRRLYKSLSAAPRLDVYSIELAARMMMSYLWSRFI